MADIFLSYARVDQEWVSTFADALASRGFTVWRDLDIKASDRYRQVTARELRAACAVVVVWSKNSVNSDWVLDEAEEGRRLGKLVPLIIDQAEIPFGFRQIQTIGLSNWHPGTLTREFDLLIAGISALRQRDSAQASESRTQLFVETATQTRSAPNPTPSDDSWRETAFRELVQHASPAISLTSIAQNFVDAVTRHYWGFKGRTSRIQFWYYVLAVFLLWLAAILIDVPLRAPAILGTLWWVLLLPNLAIGVRRLHDTGKSGGYIIILVAPMALWFLSVLLLLASGDSSRIPMILAFGTAILSIMAVALAVLVYLWSQPGQTGDNRYGPLPPAWPPNRDRKI
jgi:uncharacterized membrane protein YhaH (DUF805 family)